MINCKKKILRKFLILNSQQIVPVLNRNFTDDIQRNQFHYVTINRINNLIKYH